eukprot:Gregarina_sp_Poly_1__5035@NODE_2669_length_1847_cov_116_367978_g1694_i0_p2_GENE_NODE_2669_length_1847_cov_116_367978_g1694_i0NODE_2669_length_1847_cov_116_367978_g1694_i0_p2_ORF_typecomplete_len136_score16_65ADIP/PF11559_8/0_00043RGSlike/PF09128_11/0_005DUF1640/PF07798_11/0_0065UvrA_inter/PF17760_1/0_046CCDC106/PF15794_5/0_051TetR/PF13972_6/0_076SKA2/PF16740_5/0_17DUF1943/PF09172_11/0_16AAA_13/PF13166_6/0_22DUF3774/PF12609_8/0_27HMMR_N/PF15905_5/1_3e02HMMR_N/PF15905_5/0_3Atg14/PF10186_9/0_36VPS3
MAELKKRVQLMSRSIVSLFFPLCWHSEAYQAWLCSVIQRLMNDRNALCYRIETLTRDIKKDDSNLREAIQSIQQRQEHQIQAAMAELQAANVAKIELQKNLVSSEETAEKEKKEKERLEIIIKELSWDTLSKICS